MPHDDQPSSRGELTAYRTRLVTWLTKTAYPLWAENGIDPQNGGFIEMLGQDGIALQQPRRARIPPRQIYAFAQAHGLGWQGDVRRILLRGVDYFLTHYRRSDGLFRTLVNVDGTSGDDRALLYDQAFALLAYAAAATALDARPEFERHALDLRKAIEIRLRAGNGAFRSDETGEGWFESNPHMHLLEACLAWARIGDDPGWNDYVRQLVELAMQRFIRADTGTLGESFSTDLQPAPGIAGRIVEPGHQFEWAWLLLQAEQYHSGPLHDAAMRLIAVGEGSGVHNGVAINALLDDFSIHDANARCWPQTERLKAALSAARLTNQERYWTMAGAAAASLFQYLDTAVAGLWLDVRLPTGELIDAPAPASSFYHLVGAIVALDNTLKETFHVG